jgi:cell division transport system permease protein
MTWFPRLRFVLSEGWRRLRREKDRTWAVSGIVGAALLQVALVLLALRGFDHALEAVQGRFEMTVFLSSSAKPEDRERVRKLLESDTRVASVQVVTKEDALKEFRHDPDVDRMVTALGENPLTDSLSASLKSSAGEDLGDLIARLKADASVEDVDSGSGEWQAVSRLAQSARVLGILWGILVFLAAAWTVSSTLALVSRAHREEFLLLERLGASPWARVGPFLWEGILQGLLGAVMAVASAALMGLAFILLMGRNGMLQAFFALPTQEAFQLAAVVAVLGGILGGMGAWNVARRLNRPHKI